MATDWDLIRQSMNDMIDACEAMERLPIDDPEHWYKRSGFQPDVDVQDFLARFWHYPEGAARDIHVMRERLGCPAKHPPPVARALVYMATACAEAVGVPPDQVTQMVAGFDTHCGSGGQTIAAQLAGPARVARQWMIPGIARAIASSES